MAKNRELNNNDGCGDHISFTLTEYPDKELIKSIFRHPDIYDTDRKRLRKYCDSVKKGGIKINYSKKTKYGRYYPTDGSMISATYMWRKLRSSLFSDTEYDIDIKSCHFQLLINDCKKHNFFLEKLQDLINNREDYFKSFIIKDTAIKLYNEENKTDFTKKDIIKKLLTRILYGGLLTNWYNEFNFEEDDVVLPEWFNTIHQEIKQGINVLISLEQTGVFDDIKLDLLQDDKVKWDSDQIEKCTKDKRRKPQPFNPNDFSVPKPKILARYFQERESNTIDKTYDYIKKTFNIRPTAYCYDGLQFLKKDIPDIDDFINKINSFSEVVFEVKPFDDKLSDCPKYTESEYFDINEFNMLPEGIAQEDYFNKYYFKIHQRNGMCYIDDKGSLVTMKNEVSHFAKIYSFWEKYRWSERINEYYSYGIYPDNDLCPDKVYNMWRGFDVEKYIFNEPSDISVILYHFEVVANFNNDVVEYLLNYFAHLVQKPHKKTGVCLLIQGLQGTGKTTLVENLLKKIMGKRYVFDTSDIDKIVGRFNGAIAGRLMCVLNEASGKDTNTVVDKIKDIITRTDVTIENKGIDPMVVDDYCNYCFTTNNVKPIAITNDDRRFQVMECSDKYKGDMKYFDKLYACINDNHIIYTFYKILMNRDISKFNPETHRVVTEATTDLHELNRDPVDMFLEYIHSPDFNKWKNKYRSREIYDEFKIYMNSIGYKSICNLPVFGKILKGYTKKYDFLITHPNNVSTLQFNWEVDCQIDPE